MPDFADCEIRDGWFLEQDVNSWSSLGFVVVGVVIAATVVRRRLPPSFLALAVVAAAEGVGSWLYHGGTGDVAQFVHDVALVGALGLIAGWHVGRVAGGSQATDRGAIGGVAAGLAVGSATWAADVTNIATAVGVIVIAGAELVARRRRLTPVWTASLLVVVAVAAATWLAGTPASPMCDQGSWLQPHAMWHVLAALVLFGWFDRATIVQVPDRAPRLFRRATDRLLGLLAKALAHAFHRSIEVAGRDRIPTDRPALLAANHGNGFVDPIVLAAVLGRLPRFMAKAALWKVPVARPFLGLAGVLPVYRASDGDRVSDNRSVFAACHDELARGATVAIFPEGTTGDRASLDRVKAGAARIALGAVGVAPDVVILPVGLAFESRVETRNRALVMLGEPIEIASRIRHGPPSKGDEPDADDVRLLTADITAALEALSPEFHSVHEREVLRAAARATSNSDRRRGEARFGEVELLARRLAAAPQIARDRVVDAYRRYATQLQLIGLDDEQLGPSATSLPRLVLSIAALVVLGSVVVTATLIHLPALILVVAATGMVRSTATKGTVRLLVGLVAGLLTWTVAGIVAADGVGAVVAGALVAVEGAIALAVWTPLSRAVATVWGRLRARDRVALVAPALAERAALVDAVRAAVAGDSGHSMVTSV